jgi:GNAT superfamily N-acetyltransferase
MQIKLAETEAEIARCFPVMAQLRPHLAREEFVARAKLQAAQDGYRLAYLEDDGAVKAVAGFRFEEMLSRGRFLYVDDLVTDERERSKGYGGALFDWLVQHAREQGCARLHLDSGLQRKDAHRFYERKGMQIQCYHFGLKLDASGSG